MNIFGIHVIVTVGDLVAVFVIGGGLLVLAVLLVWSKLRSWSYARRYRRKGAK